MPGKNKPVFRASVLGGIGGLVWSGNTGWNGQGQVLALGKPPALCALQSASFTLVTAVTYHAGSGFVVEKAADAGGGVFGISVFDSLPGRYNSTNRGIPVTPDEMVTFCTMSPQKRNIW